MSRFKKVLFLFLALLLPIAVFVFLKLFGKNEFTVKPLFQDVIESPAECKSFAYEAPYFVHDSVLSQVGWIKNDSITIFILNDGSAESQHENSTQMDRIFTELPPKDFHAIYLTGLMSDGVTNTPKNKLISQKELNELNVYRNCVFLLKASENAVIVDAKKRIRGQYDLTDLEDADRLIMEMKIILGDY